LARLLHSGAEVAAALKLGEVLLMPTDTLPGLHCRADRPEAVARIVALKERPAGQPFLLLAASLAQVETLTQIEALDQADVLTVTRSRRVRAYAERCWPGPHTLILPAAPDLPLSITGGASGIALRIPAVAPLREVIATVAAPLISTSANRRGVPAATELATAAHEFAPEVDAIWQPRSEDWPTITAVASSLIDLRVWPPRILRQGSEPPPPHD
jgi:L-threonylcarbamoyladenylate synthase